MKKPFQREAYNYALWGAVFGLCFPIIATVIASLKVFGSIGADALLESQSREPLLWIIDTAPFFLGLFAFFTGKQLDTVKAKNQEIIKAQKQLVLQEQLASIGKLTAGIAHEIKNPLNFVTNFAEASIELAGELKEIFEKMQEKISKDGLDCLLEILDDLEKNQVGFKGMDATFSVGSDWG